MSRDSIDPVLIFVKLEFDRLKMLRVRSVSAIMVRSTIAIYKFDANRNQGGFDAASITLSVRLDVVYKTQV